MALRCIFVFLEKVEQITYFEQVKNYFLKNKILLLNEGSRKICSLTFYVVPKFIFIKFLLVEFSKGKESKKVLTNWVLVSNRYTYFFLFQIKNVLLRRKNYYFKKIFNLYDEIS